MPFKISFKHSILILFCGFIIAAGMSFLLNFMLSGPKLGFYYDFLQNLQKPPPAAREILIINTDEIIESSDIFLVLMTLTEMEAETLVLSGRLSPSSSPVILTEAEIRRRFTDEYNLHGANIRSLFEAIRTGSVSPAKAPYFVDQLVELTEQGRDRLLTALINMDVDLIRSISVFGDYLEVDTRPVFDRDGRLRRVQPIDDSSLEHPVFSSFKSRYTVSQIETIDQVQILYLRSFDGSEFDIQLDRNANIITPRNNGFRTIDISLFHEYEEAEIAMRAALIQANEMGAFSMTLPEKAPLYIGEYAYMLKEELLKFPDNAKRAAWIRSRTDYFNSLNEYFRSQVNTNLFSDMREKYYEFLAVRMKLENELAQSFCIMGPQNYAQYQALMANALITGGHIKTANDRNILIWSISAAFVVLLIIFLLQPAVLLFSGIGLCVLASIVFSCIFIFFSYWIDPAIVFGSSVSGTLVVFYMKRAFLKHRTRRFRTAYGTVVSPDVLEELIRTGKPRLSDTVVSNAAVVVIKDINLLNSEDNEMPQYAGKAKKAFYSSVKNIVHSYGAVIAGFEGNTVLACFGSPLDNSIDPVNKACFFVKDLLKDDEITWRFGIDAGECTFFWSPETGYSVNGKPAVRARVLASKTNRLKVRALITGFIRERINSSAKKIDSLSDGNEPIYEFSIN